jgi:septal ring factor EnvC (AmiA/AmiB activator)
MEAMRMARTKTISSVDSEIVKTQEMLAKAKYRYDSLAEDLKTLMDKKRELQSREIMAAFIKSGKSYSEIMNFLDTRGK